MSPSIYSILIKIFLLSKQLCFCQNIIFLLKVVPSAFKIYIDLTIVIITLKIIIIILAIVTLILKGKGRKRFQDSIFITRKKRSKLHVSTIST